MTTFTIYRNAINTLTDQYDAIKVAAVNRKMAQQMAGDYHPDTERLVGLETEAVNRASWTLRTYINVFGDPAAMRIGKAAERLSFSFASKDA